MIKEIIKFINLNSEIKLIPAYSGENLPQKPYATYLLISKNVKDFYGRTNKIYDKKNSEYIETRKYREVSTIQFDVYENNIYGEFEKAQKLFEIIIFNLRKKWGYLDVGIVSFSNLKNLREEIQNKYERRCSFDVSFEYMNLTDERRVEIAKMVDILVNEERKLIKED